MEELINTNAPLTAGFYQVLGKRVFDIVVSLAGLIAFAPLIAILAVVVGIDGGKPFFGHLRVGKDGRPFRCLKLRSMHLGAEQRLAAILASDPVAAAEWAADHKLTNDPRVTRIGAFLRKSSLDELPQLVCVLLGQMSLVGPRPVPRDELAKYGPAVSSYIAVKPGLTGPWQVGGRNEISYEERVSMDVGYAGSVSFGQDLTIVAKTALSVLRLTGR